MASVGCFSITHKVTCNETHSAIRLSVAALVGHVAFNDARRDLVGAVESRCAACAANDVESTTD